ncbi:MAG: polyamine aminopropyltransferase [bacterium]
MANRWFVEKNTNVRISHRVKEIVLSTRSKYQQIDVVDTYGFGRMLFLDNMAQSSELDEFIYHEMMVHPALFTHAPIRSVCIIGGAEGATLREALKHDPKRVVMIDIDEELVRICKTYLPAWSQGAYEDSRVEVRFEDGRKFLEETREKFDAIIIDLSDPLQGGPSTLLYTKEFYRIAYDRLSPRGCAAVQSETLNPARIEAHARVRNTLRQIFPFVRPYGYMSHSYHELYSFTLASKVRDPEAVDIDRPFRRRRLPLRYYSPELHAGMFKLPRNLHDAYQKFDRPITDEDVVYYPDKVRPRPVRPRSDGGRSRLPQGRR